MLGAPLKPRLRRLEGERVMRGARWLLAAAAVSLVACGSAQSEEDEEGFSLDAVTGGTRPFRPDVADTSAWKWHSRSDGECALSPQASVVLDAAKRAKKSDDIVPKDLYLTTR